MKRLFALILAGMMVCSLTACGGNKTPEATDSAESTTVASESTTTVSESTTTAASETSAETTDAAGEDNSEKSSVMVYYGWGSEEEKYTSEIFCPTGAAFDEDTLQNNEEYGSVMTVMVDDEVKEYRATSKMHWHRDAYNNEPVDYPIIAQLYFDGELDAETAEENSNCSQTVTPLGFQWNGYDVILIETKYTFLDYGELTETFVGVEYDLDYWKVTEGTGEVKDLTTKALFGFDMYSYGVDELTQDKCAWIIGELFGVDSGVANPFAVSEEETVAVVANVDASQLYGTWLERDSDWDDTYIFNADGTGVLISGPEYPFTYDVIGDVLTLTYAEDDVEEFTISVNRDLLTMIDKFKNELLLDKQVGEADESGETANIPEELIGTWTNEDGTETYAFNMDGSGYQKYEGEEYSYTYEVSDDRIYLSYDNGGEDDFSFYVDEDKLVIMNSWIYIRQ